MWQKIKCFFGKHVPRTLTFKRLAKGNELPQQDVSYSECKFCGDRIRSKVKQ